MKKLLTIVLSAAILMLALAGCNLAGIEYPDSSGDPSNLFVPDPIDVAEPTADEERIINISWAIVPADQEGLQRRAEYVSDESIGGETLAVYDVYNILGATEQKLGTFAMAADADVYYLQDWGTGAWRAIIVNGDDIYLADLDEPGASSEVSSEWEDYRNELFGIQVTAPAGMAVNDLMETEQYYVLDGNGIGCVIAKTPGEHGAAEAFALLNEDLELTRTNMALWATDTIGIEGFTLGGDAIEATVSGYGTFYRETFSGTWNGEAINEGVTVYGAGDNFTATVLVFTYGDTQDSTALETMLDSLVLT